jgi:protein-S-isoprenylcysteine O-methyltransferase Ste14
MNCDQAFLGAVVATFLITFVATMMFVRRRGHDPKGGINGHVGGAIITSVATLLWLAVTLCYIFESRSVTWFGSIAFLDHDVAKGVGIASSIIGLLVSTVGEITLGASFRLALPREKTTLVTRGIYRTIRNPCVLGVFLLALGTLLIAPSLLALVALVVNVIGYEFKVRAEEAYLRQMHGAAYEAYCTRTGRYLPLIGKRAGQVGQE